MVSLKDSQKTIFNIVSHVYPIYSLFESVQVAITQYHGLGGSNHLFLTVLEAPKSKVKAPVDQCLMRALFLACRQPPFAVSSHCRERKHLFHALFSKGTNPT